MVLRRGASARSSRTRTLGSVVACQFRSLGCTDMSRADLPTDETTAFRVKALDASTWPDFARLVERHNGVWGGCWCMAFHAEGLAKGRTAAQNRSMKKHVIRQSGDVVSSRS